MFLPSAIEADPQNATYLANRSAALISANRYQEALQDAKQADELEPGNSKVLHRLARIYTNIGRPQDALEIYSQIEPPVSAKDKAPALSMEAHVKQAEEALREGTTGSMAIHALDQAERGLGIGVDRPRKWKLLRGEAYLKMGNVNALGDAQNMAMSLLRNNNQDPEALVLRGRALYAQGDNEKALQHFRQAINCDPDYKDAVKYLRMVQKLDRMKEEGNAAFKAKDYQKAVDLYTSALEIDPQNKNTNSKLLQNKALALINVTSPILFLLLHYQSQPQTNPPQSSSKTTRPPSPPATAPSPSTRPTTKHGARWPAPSRNPASGKRPSKNSRRWRRARRRTTA